MSPRRVPVSTYRIQVHAGFPLDRVHELVPYLDRLGVTDLYSSPLFVSTPGSVHGYDVVDPTRIDPEVGGEEALRALGADLDACGMGLVLDVVPNHMAASLDNPWWYDLLARGRESPYAAFFDVDWERERDGRLLLPILGDLYGTELAAGNLRLVAEAGEVHLAYFERRLPLTPRSLRHLRAWRPPQRRAEPGEDHGSDPSPERWLDAAVAAFNASPELLDRVIAEQPYRPAVWRLAPEAVNYRRFFDIADLAGLRQEDPAVFAASHELLLRLVYDGTVDALRIDHVDGLRDPGGYLARLQRRAAAGGDGDGGEAGPLWVVVEKILAADEELPPDWPVAGTTGYDFQSSLTGVFVDPGGLQHLDRLYVRFTGELGRFEEVRYQHKRQALEELFRGELAALSARLAELAAADLGARDLPPSLLARVLLEVSACLPVYRTYLDTESEGGTDGIADRDAAYLDRAFAEARERTPAGPLAPAAFEFLARVLHLEAPPADAPAGRDFAARWQQLTGPAMAKGLEDTALYVYNRLISLNAVGGEPEGVDRPGAAAAFHHRNLRRRERWPYGMTCTSTHDAKRSEDVRARINVLSELAGEWAERIERWTSLNRARKRAVGGHLVPDANVEIFLYQTLMGAWPLGDAARDKISERIEEYLVKAVREAKVHSSWLEPDEAWEEALVAFTRELLDPSGANAFLDELLGFVAVVSWYGAWSSLAQVVLKTAAPGVPDFYQGTELWDLSLVDPDNRRPVDWDLRRRRLDELAARAEGGEEAITDLLAELVGEWRDGRIKLWVTWRALELRRRRRDLFLDGDYQPLAATGEHAASVIAFARRHGEVWLIAAVPRWLTRVAPPDVPPLGDVWGDTALRLPQDAPALWTHALDGRELAAEDGTLPLPTLFAHLPLALLTAG
jgi:(1->4)-alpha-D-glucan 1-alpha-D-glucosylmutase